MPDKPYNVYKPEPPKARRRWPYAVAAAVFVVAALAAWQVVGVPRVSAVTPGPDSFVKDQSQSVVLDVRGLPRLGDVRVTLDGNDITATASRSGSKLTFTTGKLADGPHTVSFTATSSNLFRHEVRKEWRFTVDTSIPTLKLDGAADEGRINTSPATFSGTTEPYATVAIGGGGVAASGQADAAGAYTVSIKLPDGPSNVVITTTDRAGNTLAKKLGVYVDAVPPTLTTTSIDKIAHTSKLKLHIEARDQIGTPKLSVVLDGKKRHVNGPPSAALLTVRGLAQGTHTVLVTAADRGGNVVKSKQTWLVDSTEHFGSASLWPGARGSDVRRLQKLLAGAGVYQGFRTGVYDHHTTAAVKKFQARYGLAVDGLVGPTMLTVLSGQIIIDLSLHRLYLYDNGRLVKSYSIASGQPAYPTPTGTYAIVDMQKDPTWLPPNSDWAKNAQPIPPGTANPLGTRWMGTSAPGVGIHGVPPVEDATIGTYASHGCIRMHNWDAVDLFSRVAVGMPVIIRP